MLRLQRLSSDISTQIYKGWSFLGVKTGSWCVVFHLKCYLNGWLVHLISFGGVSNSVCTPQLKVVFISDQSFNLYNINIQQTWKISITLFPPMNEVFYNCSWKARACLIGNLGGYSVSVIKYPPSCNLSSSSGHLRLVFLQVIHLDTGVSQNQWIFYIQSLRRTLLVLTDVLLNFQIFVTLFACM